MSLELIAEIHIKRQPQEVWKTLMDFENYSKWNPFIKSITGELEVGKKFNANLDGMKFKPRLKTYEINKEFKWLGHLLINGIFDGEHRFQLIDNGDGTTRFIQSEKFSGFLVPFLKKKLMNEFKDKFEAMNESLKVEVEKQYDKK